MLIRLSPEQVEEFWKFIEVAIKLSVIPTVAIDDAKVEQIYRSLIDGEAVCWAEGDKEAPRTIVITALKEDSLSGTKNLLVYAAHGFRKASSSDYVEMVRSIGLYAKGLKCDHIILYISNEKIKRLMKKYGAFAEYSLVVFPLW